MFVGDVTPIGIADSGKHIANPNVLIELGYAKKALSDRRVITVWNTAFTSSRPEDLPFDLRGRRAPITYSLQEGASSADLRGVREVLAQQFVAAIAACLDDVPPRAPSPPPWAPSRADNPAVWFPSNHIHAVNQRFQGSARIRFEEDVRWYARLVPTGFDPASIDHGEYAPILGNWGSYGGGAVREGNIIYPSLPPDENRVTTLPAGTVWFRSTGEVWSIQAGMVAEWRNQECFHGDYAAHSWISFLSRVPGHSRKNGGSGPLHIRLGVRSLEGLHWPLDNYSRSGAPLALQDGMEHEFTISEIESENWLPGLIVAWTELRRCFSLPPPSEAEIQEAARRNG